MKTKVAVVLVTDDTGSYKFDSVHRDLHTAEEYVKTEFGNRTYNTRQESSLTGSISFLNSGKCIRIVEEDLR